MGFFDRFKRAEKRATPSSAIVFLNPGTAVSNPRNFKSFAEEGYQKNVIAFRCIEKIGDAVASLPICLKQKASQKGADKEIYDHPVWDLLRKPNAIQSYSSFVKSNMGYLHISGNSYIHAVGPSPVKPPTELWVLRPDYMKVDPGSFQVPKGYIFEAKNTKVYYKMDLIDGSCAIRHLKTFHPLSDWYGLAPIEAASFGIDQHNATGKWNLSLLQNSARPSGALVMGVSKEHPSGALNEVQKQQLRDQITDLYAGAGNSGRPLLLEGGMDWKEMGFSPTDMNWIEGKNTSARDIALALGVPSQLINVIGDSTYANYEQARMAFYLDTVIPLGKFWCDHLNNWLLPSFFAKGAESDIYFEVDENRVQALDPQRKDKWVQVQGADFLTINEKREKLGYGKYESTDEPADTIFMQSGKIPLDDALKEVDPETGEVIDDEADTSDYEDPSGGDSEDGSEDSSEDGESDEADSGKRITAFCDTKKFTLANRRQKEKYRNAVLAKRKRLANKFRSEIAKVWKHEEKLMIDIMRITHTTEEIGVDIENVFSKTKPEFEKMFKRNLAEIMKLFAKDILKLGKEFDANYETKDADTRFDQFLKQYIEDYAGSRITGIYNNSRKRILKELRETFITSLEFGDTPGEMVSAVEDIYSKFTRGRAETIVRTETGMAMNESQREAAKALRIPGLEKTWLSARIKTTRPDHWDMHNVTVDLNEKFEVESEDGIEEMDGPGDRNASAKQVINCLCVTVFSKGKEE